MKIQEKYYPSFWSTTQWIIFVIVLLLLLLLTVGLKGQNLSYDKAFIDKIANKYVDLKQNHGLVIGIIKDGKKEVLTYGEVDKGKGEKLDKNAIFEIGQVSEVFTTSLLAILEMEGVVSSKDPVRDIMKSLVKVPYYQRIICQKVPVSPMPVEEMRPPVSVCFLDPDDAPQLMVLCDLATHSAGLPEEPTIGFFTGKNRYKDYTLERFYKYISSLQPNEAFGFQYAHSTVGIALLGQALAVKTKKDYDVLLKEKILDPLSMRYTSTSPNATQTKLFLQGHSARGSRVTHLDYNALNPALGIRTNVPDLLTFLEANLSLKNNFNIALSETHIPRVYTNMRNPQHLLGWGWIQSPLDEQDSKNKKKMLWQVSEQGGFASYIALNKESKTAVVVLSNSANAVDDLGHEILKSLEKTPEKSKTVFVDRAKEE